MQSTRFTRLNLVRGITVTAGILAILYLRLMFMNFNLWLDEAWVANSILSPSVSEMLYYDQIVQTTPPLLLVIVRATVFSLGQSEVSFRVVPWVAGLLSILTTVFILRRIFSFPLVVMGSTLIATNYYAIKYAQQIKSYSTDLLVACLFLFVLWAVMETETNQSPHWFLCLLGGAGIFLSFPAIFFVPVSAVVLLMSASPQLWANRRRMHSPWKRASALLVLAAYALSFLVLYTLFVRPNQDPNLRGQWENSYLGSGGLYGSFGRFLQNICSLLLPGEGWLQFASGALLCLCVIGALRAIINLTHHDGRAAKLLVFTCVPIMTGVVVSFMHMYPLLDAPRFILWMLPSLGMLLVYAIEPVWIYGENLAARIFPVRGVNALVVNVIVLCILHVFASIWFLGRNERSREEVGKAIEYLQDRVGRDEALFVHGVLEQQATFYMRYHNWSPLGLYLVGTNLFDPLLRGCLGPYLIVS